MNANDPPVPEDGQRARRDASTERAHRVAEQLGRLGQREQTLGHRPRRLETQQPKQRKSRWRA